MSPPLRIGTRGSRLALWQANHVAERLKPLLSYREAALVEIQTEGDLAGEVPLSQIGGEGVFTKEIQRALLGGVIDVAVHSLKDLPTLPVANLVLAAVPPRGATGDVLISLRHPKFDQLPVGAMVATSSLRRRAQILHRRPDLRLVNIRGNVETRLRKLREENLDALILAQAGLERLGLGETITEVLNPSWMFPAVGQGALGLECRADDQETLGILNKIDDPATRQAILAERAFLRTLGGGCQVPIGVTTIFAQDVLTVRGVVLDPEGKMRIEEKASGPRHQSELVGIDLAQKMLTQGADRWLFG